MGVEISSQPIDAPGDEEQDVHHHARTGHDAVESADGKIITLCGLRLPAPRPGAAKLPCCGMCALAMGGPCR